MEFDLRNFVGTLKQTKSLFPLPEVAELSIKFEINSDFDINAVVNMSMFNWKFDSSSK